MSAGRWPRVIPWLTVPLIVSLVALNADRWLARSPADPPVRLAASPDTMPARATNRLIHEKSPYLLQHAHNPVDWYPWGEEAFAKAKRENKPIFLSVGYSTCYWCHVMEKQSFEDAEVAKLMNEHFISIKVDREERPDVDEQYMLATQLVMGRGGWPNSVWLTPEGKPWMAGTYFPKPQFMSALTQLADVWKTRRADVDKQADALVSAIAEAGNATALAGGSASGGLKPDIIDRAVSSLTSRFEPRYGGFGAAPKFPPHGVLRLLLRQYADKKSEALLTPITKTLDAMWLGGVHDHIGGGFHRYSTDMRWLVPHFEKMLYDNAQLMRNYTDGFVLTGRVSYREAVEDVFRWLERDMTSPQGAFHSAIDSGEVGKEGEAYTWRTDQVIQVLGAEDGALFAGLYQFEKDGNFAEESTRARSGANIPHLALPIGELAEKRGEESRAFAARIAQMRDKLLAERQTWPQPHKDDKVLTGWNGLVIASLAYAGRQLDEPRYTQAAVRAADFILRTMLRDGRLLRTYRDGEAKLPGYLDDYAYFAEGLIELHRATGETRWLEEADRLGAALLSDFEDHQSGGFFFTAGYHENLIMRSKSLGGGGNVPDANGIAAQVLLDLAALTKNASYRTVAQRTLESLAGLMERSPFSTEHLLVAAADYLRQAPAAAARTEPGTPETSAPADAVAAKRDIAPTSADASGRANAVTIHAYTSRLSLRPGDSLRVAVAIDIEDGWHLYGQNPEADFLVPTTVAVEPAPEFTVGEIQRPAEHRAMDPILKQKLNTFKGRIWFDVPVTVRPDAKPGALTLALAVKTQACDASRCLQPQTTTLRIPIQVDPDAASQTRHPRIFHGAPERDAAAPPQEATPVVPDAATAWEQLRAIIAEQLNNPAVPRKAVEGILADLIQFSEKYAGTDEGTAALFNHGMLALNIGETDVAERSLRKAASLAKDPRLTAEITMQINQLALRPGKVPPDFTAATLAGEKISPKDFRGRVLLLDFWATWCGPCIAELPNVQQVYRDHHAAGFDIVSVSLDRDKAALTNFLKENALPWKHVFDTDQPRESSLAAQYGVDSIPRMLLIGRDGRLIGQNLRGPALAQAVASALARPAEGATQSVKEAETIK